MDDENDEDADEDAERDLKDETNLWMQTTGRKRYAKIRFATKNSLVIAMILNSTYLQERSLVREGWAKLSNKTLQILTAFLYSNYTNDSYTLLNFQISSV